MSEAFRHCKKWRLWDTCEAAGFAQMATEVGTLLLHAGIWWMDCAEGTKLGSDTGYTFRSFRVESGDFQGSPRHYQRAAKGGVTRCCNAALLFCVFTTLCVPTCSGIWVTTVTAICEVQWPKRDGYWWSRGLWPLRGASLPLLPCRFIIVFDSF